MIVTVRTTWSSSLPFLLILMMVHYLFYLHFYIYPHALKKKFRANTFPHAALNNEISAQKKKIETHTLNLWGGLWCFLGLVIYFRKVFDEFWLFLYFYIPCVPDELERTLESDRWRKFLKFMKIASYGMLRNFGEVYGISLANWQ